MQKNVDDCTAYVKTRKKENPSNEDYYDDEKNMIVLRPSIDELPKSIILGEDNGEIIGLFKPTNSSRIYKRKQ